jgi:ABC-2 type transport system permease protein
MRTLRRTLAIAHKEVLHMIRDVRVLYLALGLPVVMLLLFGYGVSTDVDHVPIAVVDQDGTRASRNLAQALVAGGDFVRAADLHAPEDAESAMRRGDIKAVLVVPNGYERRLARGENPGAQLIIDGSDGTTAQIALGEALGIAQALPPPGAPRESRASLAVGAPVRTRFNPAMRSAYAMVPGVIALILAMVSALLTALTVAREWERGSMEQLFATPVGRAEIVVGKLLPYAVLGFVQTLLVITFGSYVFDVPIRGSLLTLFGCSALFLLAALGVGLLASIATKSQLVSVQFALLFSMLPTMLLSGFMFPVENMPLPLRIVSRIVPGRYYITTLRGVLLKGNGLDVLAPDVLAMAGFALAVVALAVRRFKRRIA